MLRRLPIAITSYVNTAKTNLNRLHILYRMKPMLDGDVVCVCACNLDCTIRLNHVYNFRIGTQMKHRFPSDSVNECVNYESPMLSKLKLSFCVITEMKLHPIESRIRIGYHQSIDRKKTLTFQRAIKFNLNVKNSHVRNAESTIFFFVFFCHCLACVRCPNIVFGFVILNWISHESTMNSHTHTTKLYENQFIYLVFFYRKVICSDQTCFLNCHRLWSISPIAFNSQLFLFFFFFKYISFGFIICFVFPLLLFKCDLIQFR